MINTSLSPKVIRLATLWYETISTTLVPSCIVASREVQKRAVREDVSCFAKIVSDSEVALRDLLQGVKLYHRTSLGAVLPTISPLYRRLEKQSEQ